MTEQASGGSLDWERVRLRLLIISALVVALDQLTKLLVSANLSPTDQVAVLPGFLDLVHLRNPGAAFGLLSGQTGLIIGISIAGLIILFLFLRYVPPTSNLGTTSFALIVGGTLGNLIDRIRPPHYVVDFIRVHLHPSFSWPAFNVADAAITVGVCALVYYLYKSGVFQRDHEQEQRPGD